MPLPPLHRRKARSRPGLESLEARALMAAGPTMFFGSFDYPNAIVGGPDGNLWVLNASREGRSSVVVVAPDRTVKANYPIPTPWAYLTGIVAGPDGNLWVNEAGAAKVARVTPNGNITEFALPSARIDTGGPAGVIEIRPSPNGLVAGADGAIWLSDGLTGHLFRVTTDGDVTEIKTPDVGPSSIAVGADHAIWFTDDSFTGSIDRLNADQSVTRFPLPKKYDYASHLTLGPDGALWFDLGVMGNALGRIGVDGTITTVPVRANVGMLDRFTFDAAGDVWIAGANANLVRVSPDGSATVVKAGSDDATLLAGLTTGPDGAIWVTEELLNGNASQEPIARIDPASVPVVPTDHPLTGTGDAYSHPGDDPNTATGDWAVFYDGNPTGTAADFTATIDWGDGSTSPGAVRAEGAGFRVSGTHTYSDPGGYPYHVFVTITDTNAAHTPSPNALTVSSWVWTDPTLPQMPIVVGSTSVDVPGPLFYARDPGSPTPAGKPVVPAREPNPIEQRLTVIMAGLRQSALDKAAAAHTATPLPARVRKPLRVRPHLHTPSRHPSGPRHLPVSRPARRHR